VCRFDPSAHFLILQATSLNLHAASRRLATDQHGSDNPCVLIGDRDRRGGQVPGPR